MFTPYAPAAMIGQSCTVGLKRWWDADADQSI